MAQMALVLARGEFNAGFLPVSLSLEGVRPAFDPRPAKDSKSKTLRAGVRLQNRDP